VSSKFGHNENFIDNQQVEVWPRIDRQECDLIALLIQDEVLRATTSRAAFCSVTNRAVDYPAPIHYLDDGALYLGGAVR
jgi:hypothetical protein